eukprot:TRINITY_DN791_c0_g1_i1.p1 TRINITY_DN791_c0_g1~~TRINITY_DN791_c0_g1_i1.p1  ORF type:complete len:296 (+),score=49.95 TRINITY_DN791_c0_g1_i1:55-942(+)
MESGGDHQHHHDSTVAVEPETPTQAPDERRSLLAQKAFRAHDSFASREVHDAKAPELHQAGTGQYIKSMVFGGLDGTVTTFAAIAAVAGADLSLHVVIILTLASLVADAISMGVGDYVSEMAEIGFAHAERAREEWETENYLDGEKKEMVELYMQKGLTEEEATEVIDIFAKNKDFFVDVMMVEELGILMPDNENPWMLAVVTFCSFMLFGSIPLLAYVVSLAIAGGDDQKTGFDATLGVSAGMTAITLFALGALSSKWTVEPFWKMGLLVLINGGMAALAAGVVAYALDLIFDV